MTEKQIHPLLNQQLEEFLRDLESVPEPFRRLLETVSATYYTARLGDGSPNEDFSESARDLEILHDRAMAANKAKSMFLANMSHELRTPLNAVIGYSELLTEEVVANGHNEYVHDIERIKGAGTHLLNLINEILDLSKIEAGKMILEPETFLFAEFIANMRTMAQALADRHKNELRFDVDPQLGEVYMDRVKLRQILFSLISNSAKFCKQGTICVAVKKEGDTQCARLIFSVTDTGVGMSQDVIDRLFEPFYQGSESKLENVSGRGLGLAITRRLIEVMAGEIVVKSEPGVRTEFTFWLPLNVSEKKEARRV